MQERVFDNQERTRGKYFTSADAAVMFERTDGKSQIVLIEWKYTEAYDKGKSLKFSSKKTNRIEIYRHLFESDDCPIKVSDAESVFYEPFYQFMRQQFLANEMEKAHELKADIVSVLHIAPAHNPDLMHVTSPSLQEIGDSVIEVWKKLLKNQDILLQFRLWFGMKFA